MIAKVLSALDRSQQSRWFKIIASVIVIALSAVLFISYWVAATKARDSAMAPVREAQAEARREAEEAAAAAKAQGTTVSSEELNRPSEAMDATARVVEGIVRAQHSVSAVGAGLAIATGIALVVIWLGLGITYLGLIVACGVVLGSVAGLEKAQVFSGVLQVITPPVVGVVGLLASFTALMRLAGLLLSGSNPVFSIARNVLLEAVRLRVSLVFIVLLMFSLAALPLLLTDDQPLRYRVQAFLQYATGGSFMLIALLIVLFSVSSVATEQRDKIIWQTVTKPVAPWQYILGKWMGVGVLAAVLLAVSSSGIFIFTEFLRRQPAQGEASAFVSSDAAVLMSEDRLMLETQVLTSKTRVQLAPPELDQQALEREITARIQQELDSGNIPMRGTAADQARATEIVATEIRRSLLSNVALAFRTVESGDTRRFVFSNLQQARDSSRPIILRFKIQSGGNMPDQLYRVTFGFPASSDPPMVVDTPLDQPQTLRLSSRLIDGNGDLVVDVINGDLFRGTPNALS
ncbi:MAG: ABC transporter permease, partial [Phycisphaerales bacterium]